MRPRFSFARKKAQALLIRGDVSDPPVPVKRLVRLVGAELAYQPYDGDVSGMLLRRDGRTIIGINSTHARTRQRFSIAHEIGHVLLHEKESFHIDKIHPLRFRDKRSSTGKDVPEIEANQFAAELLMPEEFIARDLAQYANVDLELAIAKMAENYEVSEQAMTIRLTSLGHIG